MIKLKTLYELEQRDFSIQNERHWQFKVANFHSASYSFIVWALLMDEPFPPFILYFLLFISSGLGRLYNGLSRNYAIIGAIHHLLVFVQALFVLALLFTNPPFSVYLVHLAIGVVYFIGTNHFLLRVIGWAGFILPFTILFISLIIPYTKYEWADSIAFIILVPLQLLLVYHLAWEFLVLRLILRLAKKGGAREG